MYDGNKPLANKRQEVFVNLLISNPKMTRGEAYTKAGYNQTGHNATKAAEKLIKKDDVKHRYDVLNATFNDKMTTEGYLTKKQWLEMAENAAKMSLGIKPTPKAIKTRKPIYDDENKLIQGCWKEEFRDSEVTEADLKAFPPIMDRVFKARGWDKEKGIGTVKVMIVDDLGE